MKKLFLIILILIFTASVFGKSRTGFFWGLGYGQSNLDFKTNTTETLDTHDLEIRAGIGFHKILVFSCLKSNFYEAEYYDDLLDSDPKVDVYYGAYTFGLGLTYFINTLGPADTYITAIAGPTKTSPYTSTKLNEYADKYEGQAYYLGAGVELLKWLCIEAGYSLSNLKDTSSTPDPDGNSLDISGFSISAKALFY